MSVDQVNMRKAEAADLPAIAQVWHTSWTTSEGKLYPAAARERDRGWFEARVDSNAGRMFVADIRGEVIGFVGWDKDGIDQLFVLPEFFGSGVALRLLRPAEDTLKAKGYQKIWLHCALGNDRARAFYEKQGWKVVREFDVEMKTNSAPVPARAWHMEKGV